MSAVDEAVLPRLADRVRETTGVDLDGYGSDGLLRRARQRAALAGAADLEEYVALVDEAEGQALLEHVLVQVSGWFRDAAVWPRLREHVLPALGRRRGVPRPVRAWVAGCGEGQEVWSLAACLAGAEAAGDVAGWDLLATDLDDGVLAAVRRAAYPAVDLAPADGAVLRPHLQDLGDAWLVGPSLTARVRTARHDVRDAPPAALDGPVDLVVCRNVLMHLAPAARLRVLDHLVAALRPGGVLVLGQAELPLERRDVLVPLDLAARAWRLIGVPVPRDRPAR